MRKTRHITPKGLHIPAADLYLANFQGGEATDCHVREDAVVVLKKRMTAPELLHAAQALHDKAVDLYVHLAQVCGPCRDSCGGCTGGPEDLEDLPPETLEMLLEADVCLDELIWHLQEEDIVYGT